MKLYCEQPSFKLYEGNSNDLLQVIEPNSIDAIITDPPYELNFMGNNWDNSGIAFSKSFWEKCLSVLKPGGILLAFGGTRTFHRLACAKGATILDPFMGSGSTGKAVMYENKERNKDYKFIGIEMTEKYLPIALARIEYARTNTSITLNELPEAQKSGLSENTVQTSNLNKLW